ncbi:MAG: U32 family peptidase, partial [Lachnospiraceae bacterium]|nr:U32 family peptidase [Lachnospiraceae bacterium]
MTTVGYAQSAAENKKAEENRIKRTELLAPAGNYECFLAAIHAGADAVYLAGKQFGARAAADNFSRDELVSAIRYAHLFGRRVYMTVNTLLKDEELDGLCAYLSPYVQAGLDAVIVQDFGVLSVIKKEFPHLAIHCSTQMTITDEWGIRLAKELGAVRVVPARELSIDEIRRMKQICPDMELECFVHGAMCYCYSGQCLMSSMIGGRSGNRGACAQPCRLPYEVELSGNAYAAESVRRNGKGGRTQLNALHSLRETYPLSLKDLCAVQLIPELLEAGIDSFKIEGRMKNAEYCAGVTAVYRAVMDRFFADGKAAQGVTKDELSLLRGLYVRSEIGDGYYHCQSGGHMLTQGKPGYRGCEESVLAMLRERSLEQKPVIPVTMSLSMAVGEQARLTVCCDETEVTCEGEIVQAAANKPLTEDELRKRLQKTGGTPFSVKELTISMTEAVFMPVGQLNELRREALSRMEEALLIRYEREREAGRQESVKAPAYEKTDQTASGQSGKAARGYLAVVDSAEQLAVCAVHPLLQGICVPVDLYEAHLSENGTAYLTKQRKQTDEARSKAYYLYLPRILRNKDTERLTRKIRALAESGAPIDGIYVHTAGEYRYAAALAEILGKKPQEFLFGSPFLYCMNTESARFWQTRMRALSVPYELCEREIYAFLKRAGQAGVSGLEMPVYGHIPTMVTANCIVRSFDRANCPQPEEQTW